MNKRHTAELMLGEAIKKSESLNPTVMGIVPKSMSLVYNEDGTKINTWALNDDLSTKYREEIYGITMANGGSCGCSHSMKNGGPIDSETLSAYKKIIPDDFSEVQIKNILTIVKGIGQKLSGEAIGFNSGGNHAHFAVKQKNDHWITFHNQSDELTISSVPYATAEKFNEATWEDNENTYSKYIETENFEPTEPIIKKVKANNWGVNEMKNGGPIGVGDNVNITDKKSLVNGKSGIVTDITGNQLMVKILTENGPNSVVVRKSKAKKVPNLKNGGLYKGPIHAAGGIGVVIDGVKPVEVEGNEYHICHAARKSPKVYKFVNKTVEQILDIFFEASQCEFNQGEANSGDFIICKRVVTDDTPRTIEGTCEEIINILQAEKACNVSDAPTVN